MLTSTLARLAESTLDFIARHRVLAAVAQRGPTSLLAQTWVAYAFVAMLAALLRKVTQAPLLVTAAIVLLLAWWYWRGAR